MLYKSFADTNPPVIVPTTELISKTDNSNLAVRYDFIDALRMIGMMGIVWAHVQPFSLPNFDATKFDHIGYYFPFMQIWKFGVINFFIISGFLLRQKFNINKPYDYLKHRLKVILKPYAFAVMILLIAYCYSLGTHGFLTPFRISTIGETVVQLVFKSAFWYIINYLICLTIMVITRRYINSIYYGLLLFILTLYYVIDFVYINSNASHINAILGYLFFLWLGYKLNTPKTIQYILKLNWHLLACLMLTGLMASAYEAYRLKSNHFESYFSILRISNIIYSLIAFVFFTNTFNKIKLNGILSDIKKNTYGIYLYHQLFTWFIVPKIGKAIETIFQIKFFTYKIKWFTPAFLCLYILTYLLTYCFVRILKTLNIGYLK